MIALLLCLLFPLAPLSLYFESRVNYIEQYLRSALNASYKISHNRILQGLLDSDNPSVDRSAQDD